MSTFITLPKVPLPACQRASQGLAPRGCILRHRNSTLLNPYLWISLRSRSEAPPFTTAAPPTSLGNSNHISSSFSAPSKNPTSFTEKVGKFLSDDSIKSKIRLGTSRKKLYPKPRGSAIDPVLASWTVAECSHGETAEPSASRRSITWLSANAACVLYTSSRSERRCSLVPRPLSGGVWSGHETSGGVPEYHIRRL